MICRKATFTVSVSAVTLSNAILRLPEHKNPDFVLEKPENKGFRPQKRTKTLILCSKCPKTGVPKPKSAQKCRFCARGWLPRAQQHCHEPCGVHLAAVRQATDCRNLPRNLPPGILPCIPPRNYRKKLPPARLPPANLPPGILPRDGSRAQRAGDSDVGANDKGAGDDPGDWVDAH